jgi:hypothetical protein
VPALSPPSQHAARWPLRPTTPTHGHAAISGGQVAAAQEADPRLPALLGAPSGSGTAVTWADWSGAENARRDRIATNRIGRVPRVFHELGLLRESTRRFTTDGVVRFFAALIVTGALVGMGGASSSAPSRYARDIVTQLTIGSPEAAWRSLHPAHQKVTPRGQFARCVRLMRGASVFHIRVTVGGWRKVSIGRAEIPQRSGWSVRLVITRRGSGVKFKEDRKLQVVQVGRRLRWLLDKSTYSQYRKGVSSTTCPVEP